MTHPAVSGAAGLRSDRPYPPRTRVFAGRLPLCIEAVAQSRPGRRAARSRMPARAAVRDDLATDRPLAAQAGSETAIPSVTRTPSVPRSSHMGALACPSAVAPRLSRYSFVRRPHSNAGAESAATPPRDRGRRRLRRCCRAQHRPHRRRAASLNHTERFEAVALVERLVPRVRRLEIGGQPIQVAALERMAQQR